MLFAQNLCRCGEWFDSENVKWRRTSKRFASSKKIHQRRASTFLPFGLSGWLLRNVQGALESLLSSYFKVRFVEMFPPSRTDAWSSGATAAPQRKCRQLQLRDVTKDRPGYSSQIIAGSPGLL